MATGGELEVQTLLVDCIGHVGKVEASISEDGDRNYEAKNKTGTDNIEEETFQVFVQNF